MSVPTPSRQPQIRQHPIAFALRTGAEAGVFLGCLALLAHTWLIQGIVVPFRVASGSMWPALDGPHFTVHCTGCRLRFDCAAENTPADRRVVCPRCGRLIDATSQPVVPGTRILVNRAAYLCGSAARWDVVVARCPESLQPYCVKRLVGLPGERIRFSAGDVIVDGRIVPRPWSVIRKAWVPVHGEPFTDRPNANAQRWRVEPGSKWRRTSEAFVYESSAATSATAPIDWIVYHHQHVSRTGTVPGPILDDSPHDQAESRELAPVHDLFVRIALEARDAQLLLRFGTGDAAATVSLQTAQGRGFVRRGSDEVLFSFAPLPTDRPANLELGLVDGEVRCSIDGEEFLAAACKLPADAISASSTPLAVGASSGSAKLFAIEVFRDVHYMSPPAKDNYVWQLGPDEFFLLGDNAAGSVDSRSFGAVKNESLIGKCLTW